MKRYYERVGVGGEKVIAVISIEEDSVTVTRRTDGSRSKGKPIRVPRKLCTSENPVQEGNIRGLSLLDEGFTFVREEQPDVAQGTGETVLYLTVEQADVPAAMEALESLGNPPEIDVHRSSHELLMSDVNHCKVHLRTGHRLVALLPAGTPVSAVAIALVSKGFGRMAVAPGGTHPEMAGGNELYRLMSPMSEAQKQYVMAAGVCPPGFVAPSEGAITAVLI